MKMDESDMDNDSSKKITVKPIILAVDDRPELLTAITNMLRDDFTIMAVTNGSAALKIIERYKPKLFLLDISMPLMNGYQLAEVIRKNKNFKNTPIIFLTSKSTKDDVMMAIKTGGNDYLVKPVERELLLNKIYKYIG